MRACGQKEVVIFDPTSTCVAEWIQDVQSIVPILHMSKS